MQHPDPVMNSFTFTLTLSSHSPTTAGYVKHRGKNSVYSHTVHLRSLRDGY